MQLDNRIANLVPREHAAQDCIYDRTGGGASANAPDCGGVKDAALTRIRRNSKTIASFPVTGPGLCLQTNGKLRA